MSIEKIEPGKDWLSKLNNNLKQLDDDYTDWTGSGMLGINGYSVVSGQYSTMKNRRTGFVFAIISATIKTPTIAPNSQTSFLTLPFYVNNGAIVNTFPIQGKDQLIRIQLAPSTGNAVLRLENTTSNTLPADTINIAMGIMYKL